jgi:hypothetical protein
VGGGGVERGCGGGGETGSVGRGVEVGRERWREGRRGGGEWSATLGWPWASTWATASWLCTSTQVGGRMCCCSCKGRREGGWVRRGVLRNTAAWARGRVHVSTGRCGCTKVTWSRRAACSGFCWCGCAHSKLALLVDAVHVLCGRHYFVSAIDSHSRQMCGLGQF